MEYQFDIKSFEKLEGIELYEIYKLRTDVFVVEQNCAYPEVDEKDLISSHVLVWSEDTLAAYLRYYEEDGDIHIGRVVVDPAFRRKGLAYLMMTYVIDWIEKKYRINSIKLSAQTRLEEFYCSLKFKTVSKPYPDYGIEHIDMIKQIV